MKYQLPVFNANNNAWEHAMNFSIFNRSPQFDHRQKVAFSVATINHPVEIISGQEAHRHWAVLKKSPNFYPCLHRWDNLETQVLTEKLDFFLEIGKIQSAGFFLTDLQVADILKRCKGWSWSAMVILSKILKGGGVRKIGLTLRHYGDTTLYFRLNNGDTVEVYMEAIQDELRTWVTTHCLEMLWSAVPRILRPAWLIEVVSKRRHPAWQKKHG